MKYKEFKKTLDMYFQDNDEIYPHAWGSCVTFYKIFHGQRGGLVEKEPGGETECITFHDNSDIDFMTARGLACNATQKM